MPVTPAGARIVKYLWVVLITLLILVATYVSIGRMVMPRLENYQAAIEEVLSDRLGMQVSIVDLQGYWEDFQPAVSVTQITLATGLADTDQQEKVLEIGSIDLHIDVLASLLSKQLILSSLLLDDADLELIQTEQGHWQLAGFTPKKDEANKSNPLDWLLRQQQLLLRDIRLKLTTEEAASREVSISEWGFTCSLGVCATQASLHTEPEPGEPVTLAVNFYGRPDQQDFEAQGYLSVPSIQIADWLYLLPELPFNPEGIESLKLTSELWFDWADYQPVDVRGSISFSDVGLSDDLPWLKGFEALESFFYWQRGSDDSNDIWKLLVDQFTFRWGDQHFTPAQRVVSLHQAEEGRLLRVAADKLELSPLAKTLQGVDTLPDALEEVLNALKPSGQLRNVHVEYPLYQNKTPSVVNFRASLNNVSVAAWRGAPVLVGVNGYVESNAHEGLVDFETENLAMQFPRLFSDIWLFKKAQGNVSWQQEGRALWLTGKDIKLSGELGNITGQFALASARGDFEPRLSLLIGLEDAPLTGAMSFVPDITINPSLGDWLSQAFTAGHVNKTRFLFEQSVRTGALPISRTLAMSVDAENVDFSFNPDWPQLTDADVDVSIDGSDVRVKARQANFYDLQLSDIEADYLVEEGGVRLTASSAVKGPLKDAWRTLTETPLRERLFELGRDFRFEGLMDGSLSLDLPFYDLKRSNVEIGFVTQGSDFAIPSLNLLAENIQGSFRYGSKTGLVAPQVSARMFGYPLNLTVSSQTAGQQVTTLFDMGGQLDVSALSDWVPGAVLTKLSGTTAFEAELSLAGKDSRLEVVSDLAGVSVDLPEPFAKSPAESLPFNFALSLGNTQIHHLQYADKLAYQLRFADKRYQSGNISVGSGKASYQTRDGIEVDGTLPTLDFDVWRALFEQQSETSQASSGKKGESLLSNIQQARLKVARFRFLDEDYQQVDFLAHQQQGDWSIDFENQVAKGRLGYYPASDKPLAVDFEYLRLADVSEGTEGTGAASAEQDVEALAAWKPQALPELDLTLKQLYLGDKAYGSWAFNSRPHDQGVKLEKLALAFKGVQATGEMNWLYRQGEHQTEFKGDVLIADVASMLKAWSLGEAIEGKNARFSGVLSWPGVPSQFSPSTMSGDLNMTADEGRIVDLQALPLLGVLNFNTLSRRLRLDFSDLFKKGFSFDEAKGRFGFQAGTVRLAESLIIDGPSAKFKIEGQTDLVNRTFDHDVIVVLPINDNISVVTTLAGLPQVGIPMYLLNRAFGNVLDRFTSINYRVSGDWADPDIELASFFDTDELNNSHADKAKKRRPRR